MSKYLKNFLKNAPLPTDSLDTVEDTQRVSRLSVTTPPFFRVNSLTSQEGKCSQKMPIGVTDNVDTLDSPHFEKTFAAWEHCIITAGSVANARRLMTAYVRWRRKQESKMNEAYRNHIKEETTNDLLRPSR